MDTTTHRPRFWSKWPLTTACGLGGVVSIAVMMAQGGSPSEDAIVAAIASDEAAAVEDVDAEEAPVDAASERADKPTSASKSGLYAMKGPKDALPAGAPAAEPEAVAGDGGILEVMGREGGHYLAAPHGGADAAEGDDAEVWGGLVGGEVGEAYGVGGLGLVGTGRGGGGTGEGTIGLGSSAGYGRGSGAGFGGRGASKARPKASSFKHGIQSRTLTVGVVDDNADDAGYRKALDKLAGERARMNVPKDMWDMGAPGLRHDPKPRALDVALVIDTTGSMGDELEYLKVEVRDIARDIAAEFPGVDQRWGLVVYKDHGDEYVTREVDFRGIDDFVTALGEQSAGGGGDYPEAMDEALQASAQLSWRGDDQAARVVFLVADAPAHEGKATRRYASAVMEHRTARTAIYPVAGSGVQGEAEAQMRLAARVTGGQYIFLTDHSGVGGHHEAPKVDQFKVETLHDAMARMLRGELGGDGSKPLAGAEPVQKPVETIQPLPVEAPPAVAPVVAPAPVTVMIQVPEPAKPGLWDELKERLATHLIFVSSIALLIFAAMGADSLLRRRRQG